MKRTLLKLTLAATLVGLSFPSFASVTTPPGRGFSAPAATHRTVVIGGYWWGPAWWDDPYWHAPYRFVGPPVVQVPPSDLSPLGLEIRPSRASVTVDGILVGRARDYDSIYRWLWTKPGPHTIVLQRPGYRTLSLDVDTSQVANYTLRYRLEKGSGMDERSSTQAKVTASLPPASGPPRPAG